MVVNKKADFSVAFFGMKQNRMRVVDYLVTYAKAMVGHFYIKNPRETYDWAVFLQPLYKEAWIAIAIFFLVIPVLITIITLYGKKD